MLENWQSHLGTVADVGSLISLGVSAYAAYAITKVRSQVLNRVRLPDFVAVLERHGKNFAKLMRTYDDQETQDQFELEIAICETNLRLVKAKVPRGIGSRAYGVLKEIRKYKGPRLFGYYPASKTREQAWKIYTDLNGFIEELKNIVEEQRMGA